jgi:hypothetical protein
MEQLTEQRLKNLSRANDVRQRRAKDKRRIERGDLDAMTVLESVPRHWRNAKLVDLLLAMPKVGRVKAQKWCRHENVSLSKRIGTMTVQQRQRLIRHVDVWAGRRDSVRRILELAA